VPRERTPQGRLFEHASDSKVLLKLLQKTSGEVGKKGQETWFVRVEESVSDEAREAKTVLSLNRDFIDVALKSNGKADLYFHAYFWHSFIQ